MNGHTLQAHATEVIHAMRVTTRFLTHVVPIALASMGLLLAFAQVASASVPTVKTGHPPTLPTAMTAIVKGAVSTDAPLVDCHFEYVTTDAYHAKDFSDLSSGGSVPCAPPFASVPADSLEHEVSAEVIRPEAGAAFYYRLVAATADGSAAGMGRSTGFHIASFDNRFLKENGDPATQAGSHPHVSITDFSFPIIVQPGDGEDVPEFTVKDTIVNLPPGLVGNPFIIGTCLSTQLLLDACPAESHVGYIKIQWGGGIVSGTFNRPIYSLARVPGRVATFGANFETTTVMINVEVRSGTDYGLTFEVENAPVLFQLRTARLTFWGVPADKSHDPERTSKCLNNDGVPVTIPGSCPAPSSLPRAPFITLPTSCIGPQRSDARVTTWEEQEATKVSFTHDNTLPEPNPSGAEGCNTLDFSPSLEARPTTNVADAPSGLDFHLHVPQNFEPDATGTAHLRKTVLDLPEGMAINPSGANGLGTCSEEQIGVTSDPGVFPTTFTPEPGNCPRSASVGNARIDSSLLEQPLFGALYVARPHENPVGSLLAFYLEAHDPITGIVVKLPGRVDLDPESGQVSVVFDETPQLPFDDLTVNIFGGAGAPFRTPPNCGTYSTQSSLTPWSAPESGPPATVSDTYSMERSPLGGTCPTTDDARSHSPGFDAGAESPLAGAYSPMVVNLRREDGSQEFSAVTINPPPGMIGRLAGIPYCPDAALVAAAGKTGGQEKANPSCPAASEVGNVVVAAGAGPAPYYASGKAYLTGPYKGAPIGIAVVIPAVAGPFDVGTVVVRNAVFVDPTTARIKAVSDQIPRILEGIPLDVRSVQIKLDRPRFARNPTSCDPMSFDGQLFSAQGASALVSNRFQLGECGRLDFEPRMSLRLKGGTKRRNHPALVATLTTKPDDANLKSVSVAMPSAALLDQANIGDVCTRVQFAARNCPADSVYGEATVITPLLDHLLTGPVYLRSSNNELPDLVVDLGGPPTQPIKLESAGRVDTVNEGLRTSFESIPDAPFSKLVLRLKGGKTGLLRNSRSMCAKPLRATVKFGAQNGLRSVIHPRLKAECGKARKRSKRSRADRRSAR